MVAREEDQTRLAGFGAGGLNAAPDDGTIAVARELRFDEAELQQWMSAHVAGYAGPLDVRRFAGGQSNPTYKLVTPGASYVLRRKPPGKLLKGAHAVEREARVLTALHRMGLPVAEVYGLCIDESVLGTSFYVMEMVEGRIFWDATFPGVPVAERPAYFDAMNAALAQIHTVDLASAELTDFARPGNYYEKQIGLWSAQYRADEEAGRDPTMDRLIEWLEDNRPDGTETALVHGDFRCDNMIFHPTEPRVIAILDWELSTLGHPLADFANHAMMYHMPPHIVAGLGNADLAALNIPSEADYLAAYCRRTGRSDTAGYDYAIAFSLFRLAAIYHGIKARALRGTATSESAMKRAEVLPELIALAWSRAERAGAR